MFSHISAQKCEKTRCKKSHGGPISTLEELDNVITKYSNDNKKLEKIMNLEIRFHKVTLTKIKPNCALFKQRNVSHDLKIKNLQTLITSQLLSSTSTAQFIA